MTPAIQPQEQWRDLEIVEDSQMSAATSAKNRPSRRGSGRGRSATSSEEMSDRRSGQIRKKTQLFDEDQYTRSVITPKSRIASLSLKSTKSVLQNVVQTTKRTPGLVRRDRIVSREIERMGSIKSRVKRQKEVKTNSGRDAEAGRIWSNITEEEHRSKGWKQEVYQELH